MGGRLTLKAAIQVDVEPELQESDSDGFSNDEEEEPTFPMQRTDDARAGRKPTKRKRLSRENFENMLRALRIFPEFVQTHSMQQHVDLSLSRRGITELTYAAFVECLCRIAFIYLCTYGNGVQQAAPSQMKAMWLLTLLRVRCRDYRELNLCEGLAGPQDGSGGKLWEKRRITNLEKLRLERSILWRTMEAEIDSSRFQKEDKSKSKNQRRTVAFNGSTR